MLRFLTVYGVVALTGVFFHLLSHTSSVPATTVQPLLGKLGLRAFNETAAAVELHALLGRQGADLARVAVHEFEGQVVLKASPHVEAGSVVLSVPANRCLSLSSVMQRTKDWQLALHGWENLPDGPIYMGVLALLYETIVHNNQSRWVPYLQTLPHQYELPVNYSAQVHKHVLSALPGLRDVADNRTAVLHQLYPLVFNAIQVLPGGKDALHQVEHWARWPLFIWAYAAVQTRSIMLSVHQDRPVRVPAGWVQDVAMLVPVLDAVQHGTGSQVNTRLDTTSGAFRLVALQDIKEGDEIRYSFDPRDQEQPQCNDRWLLDNGLTMHDGQPSRSCFRLDVDAGNVVAALAKFEVPHEGQGYVQPTVVGQDTSHDQKPGLASSGSSGSNAGQKASDQGQLAEHTCGCAPARLTRVRSRLYAAGLPEQLTVDISAATLAVPQELQDWVVTASGGCQACTLRVLRWVLTQHLRRLQRAVGALVDVDTESEPPGGAWQALEGVLGLLEQVSSTLVAFIHGLPSALPSSARHALEDAEAVLGDGRLPSRTCLLDAGQSGAGAAANACSYGVPDHLQGLHEVLLGAMAAVRALQGLLPQE